MEFMKCKECVVGVFMDRGNPAMDVIIKESDYLQGRMVLLGFMPFRWCPVCACPIDWRSLDKGLPMDVTVYSKDKGDFKIEGAIHAEQTE